MATSHTLPTLENRWQCLQCIYNGTMSSVYWGFDQETQQYVAIKRLNEQKSHVSPWPERFQEETLLLSSLKHPRIVQYIGHGQDTTGIPYIVTEWLEGESLRQRMGTQTPLPLAQLVTIFTGLVDALSYLHREGIVHRDLKPANILLSTSQRSLDLPTLLDFGIALPFRQDDHQGTDPFTLGTPLYMSPEQAQGFSVGPSADLYAFGVLLFEALTGYTPFQGENIYSIMAGHIHIPPPLPRDFAPQFKQYPEIERLLLWALEKSPFHRPPDLQSFWGLLLEAFVLYGLVSTQEIPLQKTYCSTPASAQKSPTIPSFAALEENDLWTPAGPTLVDPPLHPEAPTPAQSHPNFSYAPPSHTLRETPPSSQMGINDDVPLRTNTPANLEIFAPLHTLGARSEHIRNTFSWQNFFDESHQKDPDLQGLGTYDTMQRDWSANQGTNLGFIGLIKFREMLSALQHVYDQAETSEQPSFFEGLYRTKHHSYYYSPLSQLPHLLLILVFSSNASPEHILETGKKLQKGLQKIPHFVLIG